MGTVQPEGTAGTTYFRVPVVLISTQKNGAIQRYAGCYILKQVTATVENIPPPHPITLVNAHIFSALPATSMVTLLNRADQTLKDGTCNS
jgi:hypothetical protein